MLKKIGKDLFLKRFDLLLQYGYATGKIQDFDDDIYEEMNGTIVSCLPVSLYIKYGMELFPKIGSCWTKSLYMFFGLDNGLLVRADTKLHEYLHGKDAAGHGWMERGDYVYDPSSLKRFDKEFYYKLLCPYNVCKTDKKSYVLENEGFYNASVSTSRDDFRPGGRKRIELGSIILALQHTAMQPGLEDFQKELNEYLEEIDYDSKQICTERDKAIKEVFCNGKRM